MEGLRHMVVTRKPDPRERSLCGVCPHGRIWEGVVDLIGQVKLGEVASQVLVRTGTARWQHISHYRRRARVGRAALQLSLFIYD